MTSPPADRDHLRDPLVAMRRLSAVNPAQLQAAMEAALAAPAGDPGGRALVDLLESAYRHPDGMPAVLRAQTVRQLQSRRPDLVQALAERLRAGVSILQLYADALGCWEDSELTGLATGLLACPAGPERRPCMRALLVRLHRAGRSAEMAALLPKLDLGEYLDFCRTEAWWRGAFPPPLPGVPEVLRHLADRLGWHASAEQRQAALEFCEQLPQRLDAETLARHADTIRVVALRVDDPLLRAFLTRLGASLPSSRRW